MGRFAASPADGGVYVLDTESGEVVFVGHDGSSRVLRGAVGGGAGLPTASGHPVDDIVLGTFPSPVAWAWQDYLAEAEARQKTRALVDTFSVLLKQWAFATSAAVFASPGLRDAGLHRLLERELQRPLLSSWRRLIEVSLPLLERHGDPSVRGWVESFGRVYATVETQCRERVTLPRPYLDEEGELRSNDRKMGWVEALLGLRNEMAHRALASQQIAEEDLSNFEPVMRNLLNAGAELTAWQLVEVLPAANTSPRAPLMAHPWTGRHGRGTPFEVQRPRHLPPFPEDGSLLGIATRNGTLLPLPVFYGREGQGQGSRPAHLLSFEGLSSRGIHYVAGDGSKRDDRRPLAAWNQLVSAISPPPDSLSLATMTWEVFVQRCATTTALTLAGLEERSVYHADLDTSRDAIDGAFLELLEERRAMLLVGAPGVGKTFALASHARRRIDAGDAVTLLRATDLEGTSPAAQVSNALGFPLGTTPEAIVAQLGAMSGRPGRWWLLVDGVESGSPSAGEWITAVSTWAEALGATDALRIVASTRTATFDGVSHLLKPRNAAQFVRRPRHDSAEPEQAVFVGAFDLDSTEEAYERHRKHAIASGLAAPLTRYIELGSRGNTRKVLRDPVAMRLLIRAYAGKPLPTDIPWEEAMELFLERTVRDPAEPDGGPRWKYLETIVEWCSRASVEELSREQLADHPRLGAAVFDTSMESPYAQLVDLGVLVEEWRDASCVVAVSPHRLFEHLLAGHLQCTSVERMLGDIRRLDGLRAAPGAWTTALHRTLRAGNAEIVVEALDACDHGRWKAAQAPLVQAVTQLLSNLAAHHEDELERFLETLVQVPSRTDVNLLLDAIEAARASGKIRALGLLVDALSTEATALADSDLMVEVGIRRLELALEGGDGVIAAKLAADLRALVDAGASPAQQARAALAEGRVDLAAGRFAEANSHFERAHELAQAVGFLGAASDASRWRSAAANSLTHHTLALELAQEALKAARESGDKAREGAAYHRLASSQHMLNDRESARANYERAMVLHNRTEHPIHAAASALNFGVLLLDIGDTQRAKETMEDALAAFERMEQVRGVSITLVNLAHIARVEGDPAAAIEHAARAHELNVARESPVEVVRDLWLLAELELDRGDLSAAEAYGAQLATVKLPEQSRRVVQSFHFRALKLRSSLMRGGGSETEGLVAEFRADWNAVAASGVHLNIEERPLAVLMALRDSNHSVEGVDAAIAQLASGTVGTW